MSAKLADLSQMLLDRFQGLIGLVGPFCGQVRIVDVIPQFAVHGQIDHDGNLVVGFIDDKLDALHASSFADLTSVVGAGAAYARF